ncbi:hypothetical protein KJ975_11470 [Myxococcota bacterium]|nr:hypothetical protein [Myxococcota bacterium]
MKYLLILLMFFMVSCGKKEAPASESKSAAEPAEIEKKIEETPPPPADTPQVVPPTTAEPSTGEMAADGKDGEAEFGTGDGTPVAQPGTKTLNLENQKNLDVPKVMVKPTIRTDKGGGPPPSMSVMGAVDGLIGGTPSDETMKPLMRAPKPDPQATGYHGMDQDEPTQE